MPLLWVFGGPNGAGKTTLFNEILRGEISYVNADEIAREIDPASGQIDVLHSGRVALQRREALLQAGRDLTIETTLSGNGALRFMRRAKRAGYRINLVYVALHSVELARARVADRVEAGGHDIPLEAIVRRFPNSLAKLKSALAIADIAFIFDNSDEERRLLLEVERGQAVRAFEPLPYWLLHALG